MAHRDEARHDVLPPAGRPPGRPAHDRRWAGELRGALHCSALFLALLLLVDRGAGDLTAVRALLWLSLALLLFLVLCPRRVTAGDGWLASRGPLREHRVRTDLLVSVRCLDGVCPRLLLRDAFGDRVEIDPQVLLSNPDLWHHLDEAAHTSAAHGTLTSGGTALRRITERVDRETARTVFRVSGLD